MVVVTAPCSSPARILSACFSLVASRDSGLKLTLGFCASTSATAATSSAATPASSAVVCSTSSVTSRDSGLKLILGLSSSGVRV